MITMDNIIREGHPTLRKVAEEVTLPLTTTEIELTKEMLTFLKNSQVPEIAEKFGLRGGVGLAAPQLDVPKRIVAVHIPGRSPEDDSFPSVPEPIFSGILINPRIVSHSVQQACLEDGEGCLSVDRDVEGLVVRNLRVTLVYTNLEGQEQKKKFKGYDAIVIQHEIDHLNGVLFFDYINEENPYDVDPDVLVLS